jgi:predicted DCC family thiol-disulfide oxidoreductase YuxK
MPLLTDRSARLFYDDGCGPCRLLAQASQAVSRHRIVATPLDAPSADLALDGLSQEERFGSAHLERAGELRSGEAVAAPLVGLTLGASWERVVRRAPFLDRSLRRLYLAFWRHRRDRGCAAAT